MSLPTSVSSCSYICFHFIPRFHFHFLVRECLQRQLTQLAEFCWEHLLCAEQSLAPQSAHRDNLHWAGQQEKSSHCRTQGDKRGWLEGHRFFLLLVKSFLSQWCYKGLYPHSQEHWLQRMFPIIRERGKATTGSNQAHPAVWLWQPFLGSP